jgi:hypothetical protein
VLKRFEEIKGVAFKELCEEKDLQELIDFAGKGNRTGSDKGKTGKLFESICGLDPSSKLVDLEDAEVKTYKKGQPIAISMLQHMLPEITKSVKFSESLLCKKIERTLFVSVNKENNNPIEWFFDEFYLMDLQEQSELFKKLEQEYKIISDIIKFRYDNDKMLSTINGDGTKSKTSKSYLQIRTKDNKDSNGNYHSTIYNGKIIGKRYYAFYFRNLFAREIIETTV